MADHTDELPREKVLKAGKVPLLEFLERPLRVDAGRSGRGEPAALGALHSEIGDEPYNMPRSA